MRQNRFVKKHLKFKFIFLLFFFIFSSLFALNYSFACTIGGASSASIQKPDPNNPGQTIMEPVTMDSLSLLWKVSNGDPSHEKRVFYIHKGVFENSKYSYVVLTDQENSTTLKSTRFCMGINEKGLSIVYSRVRKNSESLVDIDSAYGYANNGYTTVQIDIMRSCATLADVKIYLDKNLKAANASIMPKASGNYIVMDATGHVFGFAATHKDYVLFEPMASSRKNQQLPDFTLNNAHHMQGFLVRANRLHWSNVSKDKTNDTGRYIAGAYNMLGMIWNSQLQYRPSEIQLLQGNGLKPDNGYEFIRYGAGKRTALDDNRQFTTIAYQDGSATTAGGVVLGVSKGEHPALATLWAIPGHPNYGMAVPLWVAVSEIPDELSRSSNHLSQYIRKIKRIAGKYYDKSTPGANSSNNYHNLEQIIQKTLFPIESEMVDSVAALRKSWQIEGMTSSTISQMTRVEQLMTKDAFSATTWFEKFYQTHCDAYKNCSNLAHCPKIKECPLPSRTLTSPYLVNDAPIVTINPVNPHDITGSTVSFSATITDRDYDIRDVVWHFGDGEKTSATLSPQHTYARPGKYLVSCSVTDSGRASNDKNNQGIYLHKIVGSISNTDWYPISLDGLKGMWDFNQMDKNNPNKIHLPQLASIGENLIIPAAHTITYIKGIPHQVSLNDPNHTQDFSFYDRAAIVKNGDYLSCRHNIINRKEWTLLMDISYPDKTKKRALFQTDSNNANGDSAECWIGRKGHVGSLKTKFAQKLIPHDDPITGEVIWNRLVFAVKVHADNSSVDYRIYHDGVNIMDKHISCSGETAMLCKEMTLDNEILFFTDKNNADHMVRVSKIAFFEGALSGSQIRLLGKAGTDV